jgi:hypothetical protein
MMNFNCIVYIVDMYNRGIKNIKVAGVMSDKFNYLSSGIFVIIK